jgi:hypothetical protein
MNENYPTSEVQKEIEDVRNSLKDVAGLVLIKNDLMGSLDKYNLLWFGSAASCASKDL